MTAKVSIGLSNVKSTFSLGLLLATAESSRGAEFIAIESVAVSEPPALVAITVYLVVTVAWVGVPERMPVVVSNIKPYGSRGVTEYEATASP